MLYRTMPKNGDELSILGFGCMRFPMTKDGKIDEPRAIRQIRDAIEMGVNYLDTAWPYHGGESELILGRALADGYRDRVKIADKLPSWLIGTRDDMDRYLDAQLEKLGTDRIDYYLVHTLNGPLWDKLVGLGVTDFLEAALADGRIVNAGFSFHGVLPDFQRIVDAWDWTFTQIQYNYLDTQNQAGTEGLEYAAAKDLGVIVMEPLRGGNLGHPAPPAEVAEIWSRAETPRTPVEWALRWIWNRPEVTLLLSGMNEESHIEENVAIADAATPGSLSNAELDLVSEAAAKFAELMAVDCTGCGYCLPCPENVNIPGAFDVYNKVHLFGDEAGGKVQYVVRMSGELSGGETGYASQCTSCGECLPKCPQEIEIPDLLAIVAGTMEDDEMEKRLAQVRPMFTKEA